MALGHLLQALWAYARALWRWWTAKDCAQGVSTAETGTPGVRLVTFSYQGQHYCGHTLPGHPPHARPWYKHARRRLKQPARAFDADGHDVTAQVKPFWGPLGDWNSSIGLCFLPDVAQLKQPVLVTFNDMTVQTL